MIAKVSLLFFLIVVSVVGKRSALSLEMTIPEGIPFHSRSVTICTATSLETLDQPLFIVNRSVTIDQDKDSISVGSVKGMGMGHEMLPELYACDGSEHNNANTSNKNPAIWIAHDGGYMHTKACNLIELGRNSQPPPGYGFLVGKGSNVKQLLFCTHYHDHMNLDKQMNYTSKKAAILLPLEKSTSSHPLKQVAALSLVSIPGNIQTTDGFKIRVSHRFDEHAVMKPIRITVHMHAYAHTADRVIAWMTNASGGERVIVNESVVYPPGEPDFHPPIPKTPVVINESDTITVECYFKKDPLKSEQELWSTKKDQICNFSLLYYPAEGKVMKRNSFRLFDDAFRYPDGEDVLIP